MSEQTPSPPRPAATVLLLRDGTDGLEVFMVKRHHRIDFASGALVFPGGKVDEPDRAPALGALCRGAEGLAPDALAFRIAAIREAFEECGILLARPRGSDVFLDGARLAELDLQYRADLLAGRIDLATLAVREDLELAGDCLVVFSHWITPEAMPKRFDTLFFLAAVPSEQLAVHDGSESVDSVWITPERALAAAAAGELTVVFPTRLNLEQLAESRTVEEALEMAGRRPIAPILPWIETRGETLYLCIGPEAGYATTEAPVDAVMKP